MSSGKPDGSPTDLFQAERRVFGAGWLRILVPDLAQLQEELFATHELGQHLFKCPRTLLVGPNSPCLPAANLQSRFRWGTTTSQSCCCKRPSSRSDWAGTTTALSEESSSSGASLSQPSEQMVRNYYYNPSSTSGSEEPGKEQRLPCRILLFGPVRKWLTWASVALSLVLFPGSD